MVGLLFGSADLVAQRAGGRLEWTDGVVHLELSHLRAQLTLPAAALVVLHTSHAQLPNHRLDEML